MTKFVGRSWNGGSKLLQLRDRRIRRTNCQRKSYGCLASNPSNHEYRDPDEEKTKAQSEYIVTMRVKGSTLPAVEKKAKAAWGDKVRIEHVRRGTARL
jgi:hypothetical protein